MIKLYTSSWFAPLGEGYIRIGISRGAPRGQAGYRMYRALAPGPWFKSVPATTYKQLFDEQLAELDPGKVVRDIQKLAGDMVPVMVCFERPNAEPEEWCHRGQVSAWLHDKLGIDVPEFGMEEHGAGWRHPKLPAQFRAPSGVDLTAEIEPLVGTFFKHRRKNHRIIGVDPVHKDQAIVEGPDGQFSLSAERLLEILAGAEAGN